MCTVGIDIKEEFPYVVVTLNTPEGKNLLSVSVMNQLCELLDQYSENPNCEVVILTGNEDYFCFGGNLGNRNEMTVQQVLRFSAALSRVHQAFVSFPKITIAAIKGKVGGGGVSLVDACDFAIADETVTFEFPELHTFSAPMMSFMGVRNSISKKRCYEMMLAKPISAECLLDWGLINQIDTEHDVVTAAKKYWEKIPDCNLQAVSLCKQYYMSTQGLSYEQQLEIGRHYLVSLIKN